MRLVIGVVASMLVLGPPASACSMAACLDHGDEMQPGFSVKVTHDGKPLANVLVEIVMSSNDQRFSQMTGSDGTARVTEIPAGEFWLSAEYLGVSAVQRCFHVESYPSSKAKKRLSFEWGDYAPSARKVIGKFVDSQPGDGGTFMWNMTHRQEVPIGGATMKLTNALTTTVYTATSGDTGDFSFPKVSSGTYVLHVDGGSVKIGRNYDDIDLVVNVIEKGSDDSLLLTHREPGGGNCGGISLEVR